MTTEQDLTLLSAYLDNELEGEQLTALRERLLQEPALRRERPRVRGRRPATAIPEDDASAWTHIPGPILGDSPRRSPHSESCPRGQPAVNSQQNDWSSRTHPVSTSPGCSFLSGLQLLGVSRRPPGRVP